MADGDFETEEARQALREMVDQIVDLEAQRKDLAEQIKEIYAVMKGRGYDLPAVKVVVKERLANKDPAESEEFEMVLGMYRKAAFNQ